MLTKKGILFATIFLLASISSYGQDEDFCNALNTIATDAPEKFRNIKGKVLQESGSAITWACGIKVPGTISSRFVASMGLFYEGAVLQTKNRAELAAIYEKYQGLLNSCLGPQGYFMSMNPNFSPSLESFKKVVFMKEPADNIKPENAPPHITMEALYRKETGLYTIVIYVFEH